MYEDDVIVPKVSEEIFFVKDDANEDLHRYILEPQHVEPEPIEPESLVAMETVETSIPQEPPTPGPRPTSAIGIRPTSPEKTTATTTATLNADAGQTSRDRASTIPPDMESLPENVLDPSFVLSMICNRTDNLISM